MFNSTALIIEAVTDRLVGQYRHVFGERTPDRAAAIATAVRLALERIALSDALYHNVEHTVMVTLLGTEILRGREIAEPLTARGLAAYDRGAALPRRRLRPRRLPGDTATEAVIDAEGEKVVLPRGASDAWLTPYHVDRSKIFVHERAEVIGGIDPDRVARAIEMTRFPVPADEEHRETGSEGGLVRAADLIGQLADPDYLRNQTALFYEFLEIGIAQKLGYTSPADLAESYPRFFWEKVEPYIGDGLRYLALTQEGGSGPPTSTPRCSQSSTCAGAWGRNRTSRSSRRRRREQSNATHASGRQRSITAACTRSEVIRGSTGRRSYGGCVSAPKYSRPISRRCHRRAFAAVLWFGPGATPRRPCDRDRLAFAKDAGDYSSGPTKSKPEPSRCRGRQCGSPARRR